MLTGASPQQQELRRRGDGSRAQHSTASALERSAFGQVRVSNEPHKRGIFVSPSSVRCQYLPVALINKYSPAGHHYQSCKVYP